MSSQKNFEKLRQAIKAADFKKVCEIHAQNPELLNHPESKDLRRLLILKIGKCDNDEITQLKIKFGDEIDLEERFYHAVLIENVRLTKFFLVNGAKFETRKLLRYSMFDSFFSRTSVRNQKEMLKLLLQHGLDVGTLRSENLLHQFITFVDKNDQSALEIAETLVMSGVSLDELDNYGFSPLHRATFKENLEVVKFLIKNGADVDKKSKNSKTFSLHLAALLDNQDLLELLVSSGADINAKTADGSTALHRACNRCSDNLINFLITKGANISAEDDYGRTPFSLMNDQKMVNYEQSIKIMVKEFSKLKFKSLPVHEKDMELVSKNAKAYEHFENCTKELEQMSSTEFFAPYSYFSVISLPVNELANLTIKEEFVSKFEADSSKFAYYQNDLQKRLDKAIEFKHKSELDSGAASSNQYRKVDTTETSGLSAATPPKKYRKVNLEE